MLCMLGPCNLAVASVKHAQRCKPFTPYQSRAWPYICKSDHKPKAKPFTSRRCCVQAVSDSTVGHNGNDPGMSDWPCDFAPHCTQGPASHCPLLLFCHSIFVACISQLKYQNGCSESFKYTREDLLIAIPGQTERLSLIEASRPWRKGVDTFVALEKALTERDAPKGFLVCTVHEPNCSSATSMT